MKNLQRPPHAMPKVHSLTGRITPLMMRTAFRNVKRNRGAAGVDKVSIDMFEANLDDNLAALMRALKAGEFSPLPLRRVYIPKDPTRMRALGIPAVRDRVAQDVLRQLLDPIFTPLFHDCSFGFIRGRNCHQAIAQLLEFHAQGLRCVLDADIQSFFDEIPQRLILRLLANRIADGNVLTLVERFLKSGVLENGHLQPTTNGTPQGGLISPLLANIVLNELDWRLHAAGHRFVRYADDFVVLCRSQAQAGEALALVTTVLETDMGLSLHPQKTRLVPWAQGFDFLGFHLGSNTVRMRDKAVEKFKTKVRALTVRSHNLDTDAVERLNRVIRGTVNYFGVTFATVKTQFTRLDAWLRKRIRCMKYKRIWYTDNRRLRNKHIARLGLLACCDLLPVVQLRPVCSPAGAIPRGSPSARNTHAGKCGESTPLRQRQGGGASPRRTSS
jgi:group II intron reverse transcriptase/maturase